MATFSNSNAIGHISVRDFAERLQQNTDALQLIDVREFQELELASLDGFIHLPLSEFAEWSGTLFEHLDPDRETIVMCHHGIRSAQMCQWLIQQGFSDVKNLDGGIDAYAVRVDPRIPRY